ncbi:MAG: Ig-like domain-containing protein [bacterium]|nr:Ig-like domain-containing protein [bacterium]
MKKSSFLLVVAFVLIGGFVLVPNAHATVSGGSVAGTAAADLVVGAANADYNVSFDTNTTSTATTLTVTFPAGYAITNGSLGASAICNSGCVTSGFISVDGVDRSIDSVIGSSASSTIKATLTSGYDLGTGTGTTFRITTGITNATTSGATGTFTITSNASGETAQSGIAGVTLTPGTATQIVFTTQPASATSGIALVTQPVVTARDTYGNTDTNFTELITLTETATGTLANATEAAVAGVANFATGASLIYTASVDQEAFTLTADDDAGVGTNLATTTANAVTSNVVATKVIVFTNPTSTVSGISMTQPVIRFVDAQNTLDAAVNTDVVTVSVQSGSGSLSGATTSTASNGVSTFSGLLYSSSTDQSAFVLRFTDDAAGTNNFNGAPVDASSTLSNVVATVLAFTTQPASATSGIALVTQPVVTARNAAGATDTDFVEVITLTEASTGTLANATTSAVSGVATFSGLAYTASVDQEAFTLAADDVAGGAEGDLAAVNANALTSDVVATKVIVFTNPTSTVSGVSMTQPVIRFVNAQNTLDAAVNTDVVTAAVYSGAGTLSGTTTSTASNGVSTFSGLIYSSTTDQSAFVLSFTDDVAGTNNFNSASSTASSTLSNVIATKTIVYTNPTSTVSGVSMTQPVIRFVNAADALDTFANADVVTAEVLSGGGTVSGNTTSSASNGVATFSGLIYSSTTDQSAFVLRFADDAAGTNNFNSASSTASSTLSNVIATVLAFTTQPASATSGIALVTQPVVTARNAAGATDTDFVEVITLTEASTGTLANATEAAVAGVANFATSDDLIYTASADQEAFTLTADDVAGGAEGNLATVNANAVTSDVVATKVIVYTNPTSSISGVSMTQPVIRFVDAQNTLDALANTDVVTAAVYSGAGTLSGTTTSTASNGVSTFSTILYTATADQQAFVLSFTDDAAGTNNFNSASSTASSTVSNVVATKFLVTLATSTPTAGSADTMTLTAANAGDITDTGYSATGKTYNFLDASSTALSTHTSPNGTAPTIPASSTVQAAFSSGVASLATFTLTRAEVLGAITVNDATLTGTSTSVTVRHAAASTYTVTPSTATPTAGTAFNLTVTAKDTSGNTASGVNGTVYTGVVFISASATAPYDLSPESYPFVSGDAGTKTFTSGVTLNTAQTVTITARDYADATITSSTSVTVSASADTTAPTISNIQASSITSSSVSIAWTTSETSASSTIQYGTTSSYGSSTVSTTSTTSHSRGLTGLIASTLYHFRVLSSDASGNTGTSGDQTFTTIGSDTTAPTVSSQYPTNASTSVVATIQPYIEFSEELKVSSVNSNTAQLRKSSDDSVVTATVSLGNGGKRVIIAPLSSLTATTSYYLYASTSVQDATGNALATAYGASSTSAFTTAATDTTAPTVSAQSPVDGATTTAITASPTVTFSEAMDANTVNTNTVQLRLYSGDSVVSASYSMNDARTIVTIDPIANLANSTQYYLWVTGAKDAAGNTVTAYTTKASQEFTTTAESVTLAVTGISASSTFATANDTYASGWSWVFSVTVPTGETSTTMKFADWISGSNTIAAASNIRFYSAQSSNATSSSPITITAANTYPSAMTLNADLDANTAGRQIQIVVEAKVPTGSAGGSYSTSYGIQSQ